MTNTAAGPLRSAVIVNPVRVPDIAWRRRVVEDALAEAGWPPPAWFDTTPEDPGAGQAQRAIRAGAEVVFVCGGDGTVRSVIEGFVSMGADAALAVLPAGTGNLLAANLGLPDDPAEGVRLAVERGRRRLDVGVLEDAGTNDGGRTDGGLVDDGVVADVEVVDDGADPPVFAVMAGMGFDAKMLDSASTRLKAWVGAPAYVLAALKHLVDRPMRVSIRIDDQAPLQRTARSVLVGNVGRLQGGVRLLPDAEPDNGQMDVAILTPRHLGHWLALAWAVLLRRGRVPRMQVLRGSRIVIVSDRLQPRELDGDVIDPGRTLAVTVRPGALWLCVAQPERSPDLAEGAPKG